MVTIIYIYTLLICLSVCLYLINVKTAEPMRPMEGLWMIKLKKLASNQIHFPINFKNPRIFFLNQRTYFVLLFTKVKIRKFHN